MATYFHIFNICCMLVAFEKQKHHVSVEWTKSWLWNFAKIDNNLVYVLQLQRGLLMFPGVLMPLLDKCGISPDSQVATHAFFSTQAQLRSVNILLQYCPS